MTLEPKAISAEESSSSHLILINIILEIHTQGIVGKVVANKIRLEQRAHLSITGTGMIEDHEMNFEGSHVNKDRQDDEACNPRSPMSGLIAL